MAARKASGPACTCGQVVFDLSGKKIGAVLRCPWCEKRYELQEDGTLTPVDRRKRSATDSTARVNPVRSSAKSRKPPSGQDKAKKKRRDRDLDDDEAFDFESDDDLDRKRKIPSSRRGTRNREPSTDSSKQRGPARSSERSAGPAIRRKQKHEEIIEDQESVEVFSFHTDEGIQEHEKPSRRRGARKREVGEDATQPLDRISRRRTRKLDPVDGEPQLDEDGYPIDELPPVKPIDMEKYVIWMFLGMIPLGTIFFMIYVIYGVMTGERDFVTYKFLGMTIRGDNPWVWIAGIVLGGLVFLGMWVGYVYFFVHKKKLAEAEEGRRKEEGRSTRRASRGSRRMEAE